MLEIKDIKKEYRTSGLTQKALDGVSLNLRDSEFVAILGPSGSGKTTLLNVIGGLDKADSGELRINGVSTAKYKDRDWDTYRNHTIGFVFQSYNLIPHQTVLSNVELALTIGGISGEQRKKRAEEALKQVGLGEHIHKLPNQLSGGQMQRVAIARALVNDPDIVLADEPTGALDSETGAQVMRLLKEVSRARLVVMVTHNPELAEEFATRIVKLKDGKIIADSDPFEPGAAASVAAATAAGAVAATAEATASAQDAAASAAPASATAAGTEASAAAAASAPKKPAAKRRRASMSFLTALGLSFNNLMTKKARTILVAFAGSIGIIGIALILSLSNGVNKYIEDVEAETLSEYPVQIQSTGFDITAFVNTAEGVSGRPGGPGEANGAAGGENSTKTDTNKSSGSGTNNKDPNSAKDEMGVDKIGEMKTITDILSKSNTNDLASFKKFLDSDASHITDYATEVEYKYNVTPLVYRIDGATDKARQVNPDESFSMLGLGGSSSTSNNMMSYAMSTDSFFDLPQDSSSYVDQYDVVAGHWPENEHELVLTLTRDGGVSDLVLYMLGKRDPDELVTALKDFTAGKVVEIEDVDNEFDPADFLGQEFRLIDPPEMYKYDADQGVYIDKSKNKKFMDKLARKSEKLKIAGIVKPKKDASVTSLMLGIGYHPDLIEHIIEKSKKSDIVKAQLKDRDKNVLTGKNFGDDDEKGGFDMDKLFSVDEETLKGAFKFDTGVLQLDPSKLSGKDLKNMDFSGVSKGIKFNMTEDAMGELFNELAEGYTKSLEGNAASDPNKLAEGFSEYLTTPEVMKQLGNIPPDATPEQMQQIMAAIYAGYNEYAKAQGKANQTDIQQGFSKYMETPEANEIVGKHISAMVDTSGMEKSLQKTLTKGVTAYMKSAMKQLSSGLQKAMSIDPQAFADAITINMDEEDLTQMLAQLAMTEASSYESNMKNFGYADLDEPSMIMIYPKDFESKDKVTATIDNYNSRMKRTGEEDKVITYSDIVGTLMSSVTDIINQISMILIAFVAISLVVSSIMIGIITYISVLERKKEIGILRAMGASKGNVANVFNAETFIIGTLAGLLGIGISLLLLIPGNAIIQTLSGGTDMHAQMPWNGAIILIVLSIILTLIGGWIPSRKAAKSDPVTALRTE